MKLFDPHKLNITRNVFEILLKAFHNMKRSWMWDELEYEIAVFYMVLILRSEYRFPGEIISFSFSVLYSKIGNADFPQEDWKELEYLMQEIEDHNWDRCRRLAKSLEEKGYLRN